METCQVKTGSRLINDAKMAALDGLLTRKELKKDEADLVVPGLTEYHISKASFLAEVIVRVVFDAWTVESVLRFIERRDGRVWRHILEEAIGEAHDKTKK
jgi:hypothetical protein